MGAPVWPDALPDYPGPLAGVLAGLEHCETPYLLTVPCDTPHFPLDLASRLARSAAAPSTPRSPWRRRVEHGVLQRQPVFCLMRSSVMESLVSFLHAGERKIDRWTGRHRCVEVAFEDADAFFNANTLEQLQQLQPRP